MTSAVVAARKRAPAPGCARDGRDGRGLPARSRWRERALRIGAVALALMATMSSATALGAVDDAGRSVVFAQPPQRIVTLAPSLTELVFAVGAGAALVGTSVLSDFPPAARSLPTVGDAGRLDVERVIALRPDLVLVWQRGATSRELEQLERAGIRLFQLEPRRLDDVARVLERLGALLGHADEGNGRAAELRGRLARLRASHAGAAPVTVFYQVWREPLMTINGTQLINDMLALCGGRNIFAALAPLVPIVSAESVVAADPEAILTASESTGGAAWRRDLGNPSFAPWQRHRGMVALRRGWLYTLDGDLISRPGPRVGDGAAAVCSVLDQIRAERAAR